MTHNKVIDKFNKIEIGVVLLPPRNIDEEVKNISKSILDSLNKTGLCFECKSNIPHISLYQLSLPVCKIDELDTELSDIFKNIAFFDVNLEGELKIQSGNIFWCAKENKEFKSLEAKILASPVVRLHSGSPKQINDINIDELTLEKKQYLEKYGIFWIKNYCTPHFTVFYNISKHEDYYKNNIHSVINVSPNKFTVTRAAYGILDYRGNLVKLLGIYPLKITQLGER